VSVKQLLDLSGKVALVTGGSRGLGLQIAEALAEMGANIAISARKKDELDQAVSRLGGEASAFVCDIGKREAIVAYCRARYRAFRYSESVLDFSALEAIPIDYLSIAFVACQVAIDTPGCDRIAIGALATDTDIANRSARQKRVFDEMYACYRARLLVERRPA